MDVGVGQSVATSTIFFQLRLKSSKTVACRFFPLRNEEGQAAEKENLGDLYTESEQTSQSSFSAGWLAGKPDSAGWLAGKPDYNSAVSKPNFASKYSCESSRRDLHNTLLCTAWNRSGKDDFRFKKYILFKVTLNKSYY